MKKNNEFMTTKEAEEYYQTMKDAKAFQQCLGIMGIILGIVLMFLLKELFGLFFVVIGLCVIITKEIIVPLPREMENDE